MQIAVVGAAGFIGGSTLKAISKRGHTWEAYDKAGGTFGGHSVTEFDINSDTLKFAPKTDCVVYLAQAQDYRDMPNQSTDLFSVNTLGPIRVAKEAYLSGLKGMIFASTGNVYEPSFEPLKEDQPVRRDDWYALSKVCAEEALSLFNKDHFFVTSARIFGAFGPNQKSMLPSRLVQSVKLGKSIFLEASPVNENDDGGLRVSYCFVDDLADMLVDLAEMMSSGVTTPQRINLGGDSPISIRHFSQTVGRVLGIEPCLEQVEKSRKMDLIADISLLKQLLNPRFTPFEEAIKLTLQE